MQSKSVGSKWPLYKSANFVLLSWSFVLWLSHQCGSWCLTVIVCVGVHQVMVSAGCGPYKKCSGWWWLVCFDPCLLVIGGFRSMSFRWEIVDSAIPLSVKYHSSLLRVEIKYTCGGDLIELLLCHGVYFVSFVLFSWTFSFTHNLL